MRAWPPLAVWGERPHGARTRTRLAFCGCRPAEKLSVLQALTGKLLTLASSRDLIEDCVEEQRAARQELRELRAEQHRREREEAAHR